MVLSIEEAISQKTILLLGISFGSSNGMQFGIALIESTMSYRRKEFELIFIQSQRNAGPILCQFGGSSTVQQRGILYLPKLFHSRL